MTRIYTTRSPWPEDEFGLSRRLYRIFLLSILFGVLWIGPAWAIVPVGEVGVSVSLALSWKRY